MDEIKGLHEIEFLNGKIKTIDVKANIINGQAMPLYLEENNGRLYPWYNIISVKKVGT